MCVYLITTFYQSLEHKFFNIPKHAVIVGTALSWYFGIVYFNNDLIFTLLNVVTHGVPYMALIYFKEIKVKTGQEFFSAFKKYNSLILFLGVLLVIAFFEEYLWEILVWNEHFSVMKFDVSNWHVLFVPLLAVPQFTHYLLDGFIWKSK